MRIELDVYLFYRPVFYILLGAALFFLVTTILLLLAERKNNVNIDININTARIYFLDLKAGRITFFNRNRIARKKTGNLDYFFSQFHPSERERIRRWLNQLLDENANPPSFFEADVIIKKNHDAKASYFSLLEVVDVNRAEKRIYLDSYLLRFLAPRIKSGTKSHNLFVTEKRIQELFATAKEKDHGSTMVIRFYKLNARQERNRRFERLLVANLKNRIIPYLGNSRLLVNYGDMEVGIFDFHANGGRNTFLPLARSIAKDLARYLDVNGYHEAYSFSIGIVDHCEFHGEYTAILRTAREMAIIAEEKEEEILYYDKSSASERPDRVFRHDLEQVIQERKVTIYYRAIIDVSQRAAMGYFAVVQPYNSIFNNFTELKEYALKSGLAEDLFQVVAKATIPRFYNQKDGNDLTLFFPVILADQPQILKALPQINHARDISLALLFEEDDLALESEKTEQIIENLSDYHSKGYQCALIINDAQLTLPSNLYDAFDYFVISHGFTDRIDNDERARMGLSSTIGKLLRYGKKIIVSDLDNWTEIELVIKSGINLISSEEISSNDEMVLPVDKKKMLRLESLK